MIENINFELNTNIISGQGTLLKYFSSNSMKNIGVLVDKNLYKKSKYIKKCLKIVKAGKKNILILYDYKFEPSYQYLDRIMNLIKNKKNYKKITNWIAIGGGSVMDTVKGIAVLSTNSGKSIKYRGFPKNINLPLPVTCVPSTTGTGSEVVYNASFIDEISKVKMGINVKSNFPKLAILDPKVSSESPRFVLASSACDALVHTLESYVSTKSNNISKFFSKKAFNLIIKNANILLNNKGNLKNWNNLQWGAVYAMWALSNTSSGPTGALSYYLGSNFKISHGVAGGVFIGKISQFNHDSGYYDYADLIDENYMKKIKNIKNRKQKSSYVIKIIKKFLDNSEIPKSLCDLGVKRNQFEGFYNFASKAKVAFNFNPIKIRKKDLKNIIN